MITSTLRSSLFRNFATRTTVFRVSFRQFSSFRALRIENGSLQYPDLNTLTGEESEAKEKSAHRTQEPISEYSDDKSPARSRRPRQALPDGELSFRKVKQSAVLFVGNLPHDVDEDEIMQAFRPFGNIVELRLKRDEEGNPSRFCHVQFEDVDSAAHAMAKAAEKPFFITNCQLRLDFALAKGEADFKSPAPQHRLYVQQFFEGEAALRSALVDWHDKIREVVLLQSRPGQFLGSGFIEFADVETATQVLNDMNGQLTEGGTALQLAYARPRRKADGGGRPSYGGDWSRNKERRYDGERGDGVRQRFRGNTGERYQRREPQWDGERGQERPEWRSQRQSGSGRDWRDD